MRKLILTLLSLFIVPLAFAASDSFNICRFAYIGDAAKIKPFLDKNIINTKCEKEMTPLLWAGFNGHDDVVKLLIKSGADINAKSTSGRTILSYAVQNNDADMVKYLLKNGAVITEYDGIDPIYESADRNKGTLFPLFVKYLKKPDKTYEIERDYKWSRTETTLLIRLASNGGLNSVKLLVGKGADVNKPNSRGETPLIAALRNKHTDIAEYLLSKGAKGDTKDIQGNSLLTYSIKMNRPDLAIKALDGGIKAEESVDCTIMKDEYQEEYRIKQADGEYRQECSYLHLAAAYGNIAIADELLKRGADIKERSGEFVRMDAAGYAAYKGKTDMLKFLIDKGANPYVKYYNRSPQGNFGLYYVGLGGTKYTLFSLAAMSLDREKEMLEYLLSLPDASWYAENETEYFYINITALAEADDKDGLFPWMLDRVDKMNFAMKPDALKILAGMNGYEEPKEEPKKQRTIDDDVYDAVNTGDIAAVKKYIADGYDIKTRKPDAVFYAYSEDKYDMAYFLLNQGLDVNRHYLGDENQPTLLLWSQKWTDEKAAFIRYLLDNGADINQVHEGKNLLYESLRYDNRKFQKELSDRGAEFLCKSFMLRNLAEHDNNEDFFDNEAIKVPREKLYRCVDLAETVIMIIRDEKNPYKLMQSVYDSGIKVDYGTVKEWLDDQKPGRVTEDAKIAVMYFWLKN